MGRDALILLDTHVLLWMSDENPALGKQAFASIEASNRVAQLAVSAITFWEVAMLADEGRIEAREPVEYWRAALLQAGLIEIPLDGAIAAFAVTLAGLPRDPADRWIVATCLRRNAILLTADQALLDWSGGLEAQDARL